MGLNSTKEEEKLSWSHISESISDTKKFIESRRTGKSKSLKTSSNKLNQALLEGFEWNRIVSVAGMSGAGKSTFLEMLKDDFISLNEDQPFEILSFEWEMLPIDQIARKMSRALSISIGEIYSSENPLSDDILEEGMQKMEDLGKKDIFFVDQVGTVEQYVLTVIKFVQERKLIEKNKGLIVTLDHTLLAQGGDNEKKIVDHLMKTAVQLRNALANSGLKIMLLFLSQLNRDIEDLDRVAKPHFHYPGRSDLFAASSVYYCSDYVLVLHKPCDVRGMGNYYGPPIGDRYPKGLPVWNPDNNQQAMVYLHVIKKRFGKPAIIPFVDNLKYGELIEKNL